MRILDQLTHPLAIAMWDFSWLEQHVPGGSYESWPRVLDELSERGYDAVRIDAYPHLLAAGPDEGWQLLPIWTEERWGSPVPIEVTVRPNLLTFMRLCHERGIGVALSSWFRRDATDARMRLGSPEQLAGCWRTTLRYVAEAGLLDAILYVDLCNEFPLEMWAPFVPRSDARLDALGADKSGAAWMRSAIAALRREAADLDLTFSFDAEEERWSSQDVSFLDLLEVHVWMAQWSDFYAASGYTWDLVGPSGYDALAARAERTYRAGPGRWIDALASGITAAAGWSRRMGRPLVTTEGWAIPNYRDDPRLDWGWVKELCEIGVDQALETRRWVALCSSNFCGPQFEGMWSDLAWHRSITGRIHAAGIEAGGPSERAP